MFEIGCIIDTGITRTQNDDRALICGCILDEGRYAFRSPSFLAAVFDGVGGEKHGADAAEIAASCFNNMELNSCNQDSLVACIQRANEKIIKEQKRAADYSKMATTVAGIYLKNDDFLAFNVGDSRVYRVRGPFVTKLSEDHTLNNELRALGLDTREDQAHVITRYLGGSSWTPEIVDGKDRSLEEDVFVLCTDGISDVVSDEELVSLINRNKDIVDNCQMILDRAITNGAVDNLSIVIIWRTL